MALGAPDVEQLLERARLVAARVDRHGKSAGPRQRQLRREHLALDRALRVQVVVVETALPDGDHPRLVEPAREQGRRLRAPLLGLVGMDADGGEDARVGGGQRDPPRVVRNAVAGADRHEGLDTGLLRAGEHRLPVGVEGVGREVAVAVEPHG